MSRTQEFAIDLDKVEDFARTARPRELSDGASLVTNESGNYYSDLLLLKQNAQIPELKILYDRLSDPSARPLSQDERQAQFRMLMPKLKLTYDRNTEERYRLTPYNEDFANRFAIITPDPELRQFLTSVKDLERRKFDPATALASAALDLLDPTKSNDDILTSIRTNLAEHKEERFKQANLDVPRNGIRVRRGEEVFEFREVEAFRSWGRENGLTGEQVDFTTCFAHQSILYSGSIIPALYHQDRSLYPAGSLLKNSLDPTITLDITEPGKVSIFCQDKIRGQHLANISKGLSTNDYDLIISTYSSDISALRGEEFTPGLASSPVTFDARITTPDISKFRLLVPDVILAEPDLARTTNLDLFARNKIRGAYTTQEIASLFEERLPNLREPLARLRSEDPRFSDDASIVVSSSTALTRELGKIGAEFRIPDKEISDMRLEEIATLRKNILNIANNLHEPRAKEGLFSARDDIFKRTIGIRPDLHERFIEIEAGKIETLSEAIGAIKLAPEALRDRYKQGFIDPRAFATFCVQAVTKEVTENPTLSHDKIRTICGKLSEFNRIIDPSREINPESFVRKIADSNRVPIDGAYISREAAVGAVVTAINSIDASSPEDILLGDTGKFASFARSAGKAVLQGVGYGASSRTPSPPSDTVSPAGDTASAPSVRKTSQVGLLSRATGAAGSLMRAAASRVGFGVRTSPDAGALEAERGVSPAGGASSMPASPAAASSGEPTPQQTLDSEIRSAPRSRAVIAGILETRSRAGSSLVDLDEIAAGAASVMAEKRSFAATEVARRSLSGSPAPSGRKRSDALSEGSSPSPTPSTGRSPRGSRGSSGGLGI